MDSNRREFVGGTIAGAIAAVVGSAQDVLSKTDEPVDAAVFVITFPEDKGLCYVGDTARNYKIAYELAKALRREPERWVLIPGSDWGISCVPDRPYKISERVGVLFEFEEGKPRGRARVWDAKTAREFHQVKHCNTATGEVCYYRNNGGKIELPFVVITEWVKDLRVKCEDCKDTFGGE